MTKIRQILKSALKHKVTTALGCALLGTLLHPLLHDPLKVLADKDTYLTLLEGLGFIFAVDLTVEDDDDDSTPTTAYGFSAE